MIKINKKYFSPKFLYPASGILMIGLIVLLTSKTNLGSLKKTDSTPLIPSSGPKEKVPADFDPNKQPSARNLTPTENGQYQIQNGSLLFIDKSGKEEFLNTNKEKVVNFTINGDSIIITTGDIYGANKKYYLHIISTRQTIPLATQKLTPVVSISGNPSGSQVAIFGNYNSQKDTSAFYLYTRSSNTSALVSSNLNKNSLNFLNENIILLGEEKHHPEPNFYFDIYNTTNQAYLSKGLQSSKEKICSSGSFLFFYDFADKLIKKYDLTTKEISPLQGSALQTEDSLHCSSNKLFVLNNKDTVLSVKIYNLEFNLQESKQIKANTDETFIESFVTGENLVLKYLDLKTDELYFKNL